MPGAGGGRGGPLGSFPGGRAALGGGGGGAFGRQPPPPDAGRGQNAIAYKSAPEQLEPAHGGAGADNEKKEQEEEDDGLETREQILAASVKTYAPATATVNANANATVNAMNTPIKREWRRECRC